MQNFSELSDLNANNGYLKGKVPPPHLFLLTFPQLTTRKRAEHRIGVDLFHVKMPQLLGEETYHLVALREDCESRAPPFEAWGGVGQMVTLLLLLVGAGVKLLHIESINPIEDAFVFCNPEAIISDLYTLRKRRS